MWAVVPVKSFEGAKTRLRTVLDEAARRALAEAMLEDVLAALTGAPGLAGIAIVTVDPTVAALARHHGARVMTEPRPDGQSTAVAFAADLLAREGVPGMLTLPGDVPLVTATDVAAVLAAHGPAPSVTMVAADGAGGTNALACSPLDLMGFHFGEDSLSRHITEARRQGVEPRLVPCPNIALDLDRPDDITAFLAQPSAGRTRAVLDARLRTGS